MNELQKDNKVKESKENGKLVLEMDKPFSESNIFWFILKRNYVGIFQFIAFSLPCFMASKEIDFFLIFIIIMQIWVLILILKTYFIYKIEFDPAHQIINIYIYYPLLKMKAKQEFKAIDVKMGKTPNRLRKIDAIEIITIENQTIKFPLFPYKYSLKKENVNDFINKIKKYL